MLLEVIIALAVLGTAILALTGWMLSSASAVERARKSERDVERASAFLDHVALWPAADLDRRLGDNPQGPWRLRVARPAPRLYEITIADSARAGTLLLRTAVYRPVLDAR